jgi:hypothetical protein
MRGFERAWLRQDDFAEHLMRYETTRVSRSKETTSLPQRCNGPWGRYSCMTHSKQLHDTYERDVARH